MNCGSVAQYTLLLLGLGKFWVDCSLNVAHRFTSTSFPGIIFYVIFFFTIKESVITTKSGVTDVGIINSLSVLSEWLRLFFSLLPKTNGMFPVSLYCKLESWYKFSFIPTLYFSQVPKTIHCNVWSLLPSSVCSFVSASLPLIYLPVGPFIYFQMEICLNLLLPCTSSNLSFTASLCISGCCFIFLLVENCLELLCLFLCVSV